MSEQRLTKLCRFCCEQINERARRCPHCRMPQTRWAMSLHPAVIVVALLLLFVLDAGLLVFLISPFRRGKDFSKYQDQLNVVASEMILEESEGRLTIAVVGRLKNDSHISWQDVQIEVQFMDQDGRLIDTQADMVFGGEIAPGGARGFTVKGQPYLPKERYASYEVYIRAAKDARSWW